MKKLINFRIHHTNDIERWDSYDFIRQKNVIGIEKRIVNQINCEIAML